MYEVELYSVKQIQSCYRTYKLRRQFNEIRRLRIAAGAIIIHLQMLRTELAYIQRKERSALSAFVEKYVQ